MRGNNMNCSFLNIFLYHADGVAGQSLNEGPFDKTKTYEDNDRRNIYSTNGWYYTPNWIENRVCSSVKKYRCRMISIMWNPG